MMTMQYENATLSLSNHDWALRDSRTQVVWRSPVQNPRNWLTYAAVLDMVGRHGWRPWRVEGDVTWLTREISPSEKESP